MKERDQRVESDPDFIVSKKDNNSLSILIERYPDGVPDKVICRTLQITPEELQKHYDRAILRLAEILK